MFLLSMLTRAAELRQPYRPISAMGMGGVYMPFPDDPDAVIVNPAALRWASGIHADIIEVGVGTNINLLDRSAIEFYEAVMEIPDTRDYDILYGKPIWLGTNGKVALSLPYLGVALQLNGFVSTQLNNPAFPDLDMSYFRDRILQVGFAIPIGPMSSLGIGVKQIDRQGGNKEIDLALLASGSSLETLTNEFLDAGVGYGTDVAFMTKLPVPFEPTFSVMWQDLGSVKFSKTLGENAPEIQRDNVIFGAGAVLDLPGLDVKGGIEYRHITLQGEQLGKKIHAGAEVSLPFIDLRMGANQGYSTFGVGLDLMFFRFDAAMTTEELGVYPGQNPQTRYMAGIGLSLGFDADFNIMRDNGKSRSRRKLKQRR